MLRILTFIITLLITYVLTSVVPNNGNNTKIQVDKNVLNSNTTDVLTQSWKKKDLILGKNDIPHHHDEFHKKNKSEQIMIVTEGKSVNTTSQNFPQNNFLTTNVINASKENHNTQKNNKSTVPLKGSSKIVPRKGAESSLLSSKTDDNGSLTIKYSQSSHLMKDTHVAESTSVMNKIETEVTLPAIQTKKHNTNTTTTHTTIKNTTILNVPNLKPRKHKSKPTKTVAQLEEDKPLLALSTKSLTLQTPRKIDYLVPVILTVITLPLLVLATYILYRRGRDCWDKRHYRRMDFLIDGMYNE